MRGREEGGEVRDEGEGVGWEGELREGGGGERGEVPGGERERLEEDETEREHSERGIRREVMSVIF